VTRKSHHRASNGGKALFFASQASQCSDVENSGVGGGEIKLTRALGISRDRRDKTETQIKNDWKLGWDGIVNEPIRTRKVRGPELTLDEEDLLYSS